MTSFGAHSVSTYPGAGSFNLPAAGPYAPATTYAAPAATYGGPVVAAGRVGVQAMAFDQLDANHDGVISRAEFQNAYAPQVRAAAYSTPVVATTPAAYLPAMQVAQPVMQVAQPVMMRPGPVIEETVFKPVIQQVDRQVDRVIPQRQTTFRARHNIEYVPVDVAVPVVEVHETQEEVDHIIYNEVIVEVPEVRHEELIRQVPRVEYEEREKQIKLPVFEAVERVVEVPHAVVQEEIVEVPEVKVIELVREVPKIRVQTVPKEVERPIVHVHERVVEVPQITVKEEIVAVPVNEVHELIREVAVPERQIVDKEVVVPQIELHVREVEVSQPEVVEQPVERVEVETREIIKQVPKYEIRYIDKKVIKHQIEYIEKLVEVPHIIYEERVVEVPHVEQVVTLRHRPVTSVQQVPKQIPKHIVQVHQRVEEAPTVLHHEVAVEVPEVAIVEAITEVPRPQVEVIHKEIPKIIGIIAEERIEEVPVRLNEERAIEVVQVQEVDAVTQVIRPEIHYVDKAVPFVETKPVERIVEVTQAPLLEEHPVAVPQIQVVEALRQEPYHQVQTQTRSVPKYHMEYRERVVEADQFEFHANMNEHMIREEMLHDNHHHHLHHYDPFDAPFVPASSGSLGGRVHVGGSPLGATPARRSRPSSPAGPRTRVGGSANVPGRGTRPPPSKIHDIFDDSDVMPHVSDLNRDRPMRSHGGSVGVGAGMGSGLRQPKPAGGSGHFSFGGGLGGHAGGIATTPARMNKPTVSPLTPGTMPPTAAGSRRKGLC
eukprot:TRINITY_DN4402_c0_g1_i1.p1 TRINITY_DN4402_c0_g1~~TRINITY_DN4402_c0_g1_i1.p1  ORF type:complete len:770 (+),score=208.36 TRINITY_DN4402_c0_g1_i1:138-2447(+)